MKLAKDSQGIYGVEVRKPILESTDTYCYVLKLASMAHDPEIINIRTVWPEARVCIDGRLRNPKNSKETVVHPIKSECTHEMILTYGESTMHTIFRYSRAHLNGRRALIGRVLSNLVDYFKLEQYLVAVYGPEPFRKDMQVFEVTWNSPSFGVPAILDTAISTPFIEKGLSFWVRRQKNSTGIQFFQQTGQNDSKWVERYLKGFTFSFDRIAGATNRPCIDIINFVTQLFIISPGKIMANTVRSHELQGYRIHVSLPINADIQRLIYVYLYSIFGPLCSKISSLKAFKWLPKNCFHLEIDTGKQYYKEIHDLFCQMAIDLSPVQAPSIGYRDAAVDAPITYFDFQSIDWEVGLFPRPPVTSCEVKNFYNTPEAALDIFALAYEMRPSIKRKKTSPLTKNDYKLWGVSLSSSHLTKRRIRRMMAKLEREMMSASSDTDDTELSGYLPDSDDELEDSKVNPQVLFSKYSKKILQNQIAIKVIQQELSAIQKQCQECRALKDSQQRLVIFELFSKVKKLFTHMIPEGSCIVVQLSSKSSPLNIALKNTGIEDISRVVRRAMVWLALDKLDHTNPEYTGEDLFYVKSKELRALFSELLPHYQERNVKVPEVAVVTEQDSLKMPTKLNWTGAMARKKEAQKLADQLNDLILQFTEARRESKDCMAAYRDREYILVGNVFKKCLDELTSLAGPQDIYTAAAISDHPVRMRMNQLGITDGALKNMSSFLVQYGNPAAHPPADRFDQRALNLDSDDDIIGLIEDFKFLRVNLDRLNEIFKV